MLEILIGCGLVLTTFAKNFEFSIGPARKLEGRHALNPWLGRMIFIAIGLGLILDGISKLPRHH